MSNAAVADVNNPAGRDPGEWPDGDLPEQMGGSRQTLLPGQRTFRIPENVAQLWHDVEIEDTREFLASGQPNPTKGQKIKRKQLKFSREAPLIVVGGAEDGQPMTATFTNNPRPRGKKDDSKTPWISDLAYLLELGLQDKSRPTSAEGLVAAITKHGGRTIRLETGLTGQCRADQAKYIEVVTAEGSSVMQDPSGAKGCGKRYYTKDFKNPSPALGEPPYDTEVACATPGCGAILRGFENVERVLAPLGGGTK